MIDGIKNQIVLFVVIIETIRIRRVMRQAILQHADPRGVFIGIIVPVFENISLIFKERRPRRRIVHHRQAENMRFPIIPIDAERIIRSARLGQKRAGIGVRPFVEERHGSDHGPAIGIGAGEGPVR